MAPGSTSASRTRATTSTSRSPRVGHRSTKDRWRRRSTVPGLRDGAGCPGAALGRRLRRCRPERGARSQSVATPTDPTVFARVSQLSPEQLKSGLTRLVAQPVPPGHQLRPPAGRCVRAGIRGVRADPRRRPHQRRPARRPIDLQLRDQRRPADIRSSAFVNDENGKVYMLLVRCSAKCYRERVPGSRTSPARSR